MNWHPQTRRSHPIIPSQCGKRGHLISLCGRAERRWCLYTRPNRMSCVAEGFRAKSAVLPPAMCRDLANMLYLPTWLMLCFPSLGVFCIAAFCRLLHTDWRSCTVFKVWACEVFQENVFSMKGSLRENMLDWIYYSYDTRKSKLWRK